MSDSNSVNRPSVPADKQSQSEISSANSMQSGLKYLDRKYTASGQIYYAETKDEELPEQVDWWQKYALCLTRHMSRDNKAVQKTSLQINSEHLKQILRELIPSFPGVSFQTKDVEIDLPCRVLFHYHDSLTATLNKLEAQSEAAAHLRLLNEFVNEQFGEVQAETENLLEQGLINYANLWTIFKPGDIALSSVGRQERAFTIQSYGWSCSPPSFDLNLSFIDFDGDKFGFRATVRGISQFSGAIPIASLPVLPLSRHSNAKAIRRRLIDRGRRFEGMAGMSFWDYEGIALGVEKINVNSRVVIDCKTFHRINANSAFEVTSLSSADLPDVEPSRKRRRHPSTRSNAEREVDGRSDRDTQITFESLTDDQCLQTNSIVRGFSFTDKEWLDFYVEKLTSIRWNENCFNELVLPDRNKNIVKALVSEHARAGSNFEDIVKGKGKGLVFVLHGPPGVGKTLTAECVAEFSKRPLYTVSSGDLGTDSETLDSRLSQILDIASVWRAVLLIDEADVFLERRSMHDMERNALVSIFLRVLEYYQGILFLTSNRITAFDDAFKSRIHVPLKYEDLSQQSRVKIWQNFLSRVEGANISGSDLQELSHFALNGRQIKNIVRTAKSLGRFERKELDLRLLQQVIEIQMDFERDFECRENEVKTNGNLRT